MAEILPQTLALKNLRSAIATGRLRPGAQIRQHQLARELGVSPIPVREALAVLEGEGQVTRIPQRGYFVAVHDIQDLADAYRLRRVIEPEAIRSSMTLLTEADLDVMRQAMRAVTEAGREGDVLRSLAENRRFHFALFDPCGRTLLLRHLGMLWDSVEPSHVLYLGSEDTRDRIDRDHVAILDAAAARDDDTVVRLMDEHRAMGIQRIVALSEHAPIEGAAD